MTRTRLDQYVSAETLTKLRAFSSQGRTAQPPHPEDWNRWHAFVLSAHAETNDVPPRFVGDWLRENGWSEPPAAEFAIRFDACFNLLDNIKQRGSVY